MIETNNIQHKPLTSLPSELNPDSLYSFGIRIIHY